MPAADHDLTGPAPPVPALPGAAAPVLAAWLDRLAAALPGPRRPRAAIVDELRDGLHEATRARLANGAPAEVAANAAIAEFGDPATVASAFADELAAARARTMTLALVGTGPLIGIAWLGALLTSPAVPPLPIPPWQGQPTGLWTAWPLVPAAVATVVAAAVLVLATTGRLSRWLPARPRTAPTAAATAGLTTAAVDLALLAMLAAQVLRTELIAGPLLPLAAAASLIRLILATRAARDCLTARM